MAYVKVTSSFTSQLPARESTDITDAGDIYFRIDDLQSGVNAAEAYSFSLQEMARYIGPLYVGSGSFNVLNYGATGDGTTDDTAGFLAAIAAAEASLSSSVLGAQVFVPQGRYVVKETLVIKDGVQLVGDAKRGSVLLFSPIASDTCIEMGDGVDTQNAQNQVRNLEIRSSTAGFDKVGIHVRDCSQALVDNVYVRFSDTAGNHDDIGIKVAGRENSTFNNITIYAPCPIVIDDTGGVGSDNMAFSNLYLVSDPAPSTRTRATVFIDPTTVASHISFHGRQAWAKGDYGVYYDCNVTSVNFPSLRFQNVRMEQSTLTTGYGFYFDCTQGDLKVVIDNCKTDVANGGLYARDCSVFAHAASFNRGSGATADTINIEDVDFTAVGCEVRDSGTFDFGTGAQCLHKSQPKASENLTSNVFPYIGSWVYPSASATAPCFGAANGVATYSHRFTIPDGRKHAVSVIAANGAIAGIMDVVAWDTGKTVFAAGTFALWDGDLDGGSMGVKILTNTTDMSTTANNNNTFNVWTPGATLGTLYLQNKLGAAVEAFVNIRFRSTTDELGNDYTHTSDIA